MAIDLLDMAVCCLDSPRTRAYLAAFARLGVAPAQAVLMTGGGLPDGLTEESARCGYAQDWYDPTITPEDALSRTGTQIFHASSPDINGPETRAALERLDVPLILFTGGGIVSAQTLAAPQGRLVHVHPGAVPTYRGSTCFYYSLLDTGTVGASMFFMEEQLDAGPTILVRSYVPNVRLGPDQPLFMDHVLDPCLRAEVLAEALAMLLRDGALPETPQPRGGPGHCYVAHPVIRALASNRLAAMYDPQEPQGLRPVPLHP